MRQATPIEDNLCIFTFQNTIGPPCIEELQSKV